MKVLDFGLVKAVDADQAASLETAAGVIPGTPAYIAPEVALAQPVDGRADLYSLGAVAYFLLSGHLVFEGATSMQMLVRRLQEEPPSLASRTELPVPRELERIVLWCLDRRPDDRPQTAASFRGPSPTFRPIRGPRSTRGSGGPRINPLRLRSSTRRRRPRPGPVQPRRR